MVADTVDPGDMYYVLLDGNTKYQRDLGGFVRGEASVPGGCQIPGSPHGGNIGFQLIEVNMTHISTTLTVEFNTGVIGIQGHLD